MSDRKRCGADSLRARRHLIVTILELLEAPLKFTFCTVTLEAASMVRVPVRPSNSRVPVPL